MNRREAALHVRKRTIGLAGKGGAPAGLALDVKNHILFAACADPQTMVMLDANDGTIIGTVPIGSSVDGAAFNPATMAPAGGRGGLAPMIPDSFSLLVVGK